MKRVICALRLAVRARALAPLLVVLAGSVLPLAAQAAESWSFGVLSQRSAVLTAQYWNPILDYVQRTTGVALELKIARSAPESNEDTAKGLYDFVYSNAIFQPRMVRANYQVILRPKGDAISGQIVTLENSPVKTLKALNGQPVGFPSPDAVVGYAVPMDALLRQGIAVVPVYGGNQEGIMAQLKAGRVVAAGVNGQLMQTYAAREALTYRVLWESQAFLNLPIAVHPRVPKAVVDVVRQAIDGMEANAEGRRVLEATARAIGQKPPYGFRMSSPADYRNYQDFYRHTVHKGDR